MIRAEPSGLIGLIDSPADSAMCLGCIPFSEAMTRWASSLPELNSIPAYRSSVFSRTMTTSTLS